MYLVVTGQTDDAGIPRSRAGRNWRKQVTPATAGRAAVHGQIAITAKDVLLLAVRCERRGGRGRPEAGRRKNWQMKMSQQRIHQRQATHRDAVSAAVPRVR